MPLPGLTPPRELRTAAGQLSMAVALIALVGMIPAGLEAWRGPLSESGTSLPAWAVVMLLAGTLQIAYVFYLIQLPDWSTLWVMTTVMLVSVAGYAMLLGVRLLVNDTHPFVIALQLDSNRYHRVQEAGWCFIMLMLTGLTSYFAGRLASFWSNEFAAVHKPDASERT